MWRLIKNLAFTWFFLIFFSIFSYSAVVRSGGGGGSGGGTECSSSSCDLNASTTLATKTICLADGTHCPAASASPGGGLNAVQYSNGSVISGKEQIFSFNATNVGIGTSDGINAVLDVRGGVYISATSNVGIGTTGPRGLLEINGANGASFRAVNTTTQSATQGTGLAGSSDDGSAMAVGNRLGFLAFGGAENTTHTIGFGAAISGFSEVGTWTTGSIPSNLRFETVPSGSLTRSERMRIDSTGNVGINSTAPGQVLDIQGTARMTGFQLTGNGAASGNVMVTNTVGVGTWMAASTLPVSGGSGTINSGTVNRAARYTGSTTLDSSVLIFDDATNVGIGTINPRTTVEIGVRALNILGSNVGLSSTAPGQVLDVNGFIRSTSLTASKCVHTDGTGTLTSAAADCGSGGTAAGGLNAVQYNNPIGTFAGTENLFSFNGTNVGIGTSNAIGGALIITGGNVGIGSLAPGQVLDVTGNLRVNAGSAATPAIVGLVGNNTTGIWFPIANTTAISTNALERLRVDSSGNIGINTVVANAKLAIAAGNIGISTVASGSTYLNTAPPVGGMIIEGNVGLGTWQANNALIVGTGNVGIGSLAPGQLLDVNGTMRASNSGDSYFLGNLGIGTQIPGSTVVVSGNVGIGTDKAVGGLAVMSNNIGIGTWVPTSSLSVMTGNVGIGTVMPLATLEVKGTMTVRGAQTSPFTVKSGTNTACNTTCGTSMCIVGEDTLGLTFLACSDATADVCVCAGP